MFSISFVLSISSSPSIFCSNVKSSTFWYLSPCTVPLCFSSFRSWLLGFGKNCFYCVELSAPTPNPPTWRTRVSLFVWVITIDLSGMGGPSSSICYRPHSSQDHVTTQAPWSGWFGEGKTLLALTRIEPRFLCRSVHNLVTIPTELTRLLNDDGSFWTRATHPGGNNECEVAYKTKKYLKM